MMSSLTTKSLFPFWMVVWLQQLSPSEGNAILIPGDGGSALEIRIDMKPHTRHWWCTKSTHGKWERLWLQPSQLLPKQVDCWSDNIKLHYNESLDLVSDAPGTEIRVAENGLELVHGDPKSNVYHDLMATLKQQAVKIGSGHVADAATYDFRYSPRGKPSYLENLKRHVEEVFDKTQSPVTLITHSLGSLFGHYLLTRCVATEWKNKYIAGWIPISPAFGGAVVLLLQFTSGDSEGIRWLSGLDVREEQRSYESNVWLLPSPNLWSSQEVLVETATKNYTAHDYEDLFRSLNYEDGVALWNRVKNLTLWDNDTQSLADPQVPVYPIYGTNVSTVVQYKFNSDFDKGPSSSTTSFKGDGTIPLRSLEAGNGWRQSHPPMVVSKATHSGILSDGNVISRIIDIVQKGATSVTATAS